MQKYLSWGYLTWLEQSSVIKVLVAEKCERCDIYIMTGDVYEEACF